MNKRIISFLTWTKKKIIYFADSLLRLFLLDPFGTSVSDSSDTSLRGLAALLISSELFILCPWVLDIELSSTCMLDESVSMIWTSVYISSCVGVAGEGIMSSMNTIKERWWGSFYVKFCKSYFPLTKLHFTGKITSRNKVGGGEGIMDYNCNEIELQYLFLRPSSTYEYKTTTQKGLKNGTG